MARLLYDSSPGHRDVDRGPSATLAFVDAKMSQPAAP
jgi:hypothetical protein